MKATKRLIAFVFAMAMTFAMTATVFAANININGGANGSKYAAYKILNATNSEADTSKFAYTVNDKYQSVLEAVTGKTKGADIVKYIENLTEADDVRAFADAVFAKLDGVKADATTDKDVFEGVDQGYYLIAETETANDQDSISLVMLGTAGLENLVVTTKEDVPSVEKKLKEKNDSTGAESDWQDGADYDIGDAVPFKLTGTVSAKIADYKTYYYEFHDTLSKGLTFNNDVKVTLVNEGQADVDVTSAFTVEEKNGALSVKIADLKKVENVIGTTKVVVTYTATLNKDAVIGSAGNLNDVYLEYSNNPYSDGDGDNTGVTPKDAVIVFTYVINANKVDGDGNALEGAEFTLKKYDAAKGEYVDVAVISGVTTFTFKGVDAGLYKLVESVVPDGYNKADDIEFEVEATYVADLGPTGDVPSLENLVVRDAKGNIISEGEKAVFATELAAGSVVTDVMNLSGSALPSTGGMGTTIIYIIGGILVLGAGVVLIAKKRMN